MPTLKQSTKTLNKKESVERNILTVLSNYTFGRENGYLYVQQHVNLSSCPPSLLIAYSQTNSTAHITLQISITMPINAGVDETAPY